MGSIVIRLRDELLKKRVSSVVDPEMLCRASRLTLGILDVYADAERRQLQSGLVKDWIGRINDLCHDAIDLLEELNMQAAKKVRLLGYYPLSCFNPLLQVHMGRGKMEGIIRGLESVLTESAALGLQNRSCQQYDGGALFNWRETTSLVEGSSILGRDDEKDILIRNLLNRGGETEDIEVFSIVGTAGLGKTALAQLVYHHDELSKYFDIKIWVCVSQELDLQMVVRRIIDCFTFEVVDDAMEALELRFREATEGRRCLLVLDDFWNEGLKMWPHLKLLFNFCGAGSRILITTRHGEVARITSSKSTNIMHLSHLSELDCWSIIKLWAFLPSDDETLIEMIFTEAGRDLAKKCEGVPLIARTIAGVLRFKKDIKDWVSVLESNLWTELSGILSSALMLSYSAMSDELRQCLLYCSVFPKNHSIDVEKLIKLWIAQDFVVSDHEALESAGWRCVGQLADHSVFQEFKKDKNGNFKCKLEGAFRDFLQSLPQNQCHVMLLDHEKEPVKNNVPKKYRHCTLNFASQTSLPEPIDCAGKLHTLMIFSKYSYIDTTNLASLLSHMRRVRAMDLSSCSINELPVKVGELLHLRYLDLSFNHDLKKLPKAICNLLNLQTLNLNGCDSLRKLPKGIGKLVKLRHLEILWTTSLSYIPKGIECLAFLRTLNRFFGNHSAGGKACQLGDLGKLNNIQGCMTIDGLGDGTDASQAEKAGLKNKKDLLGLELWFSVVGSESKDESILEALEAPPELQALGIFYYRGELFPNWMTKLENLTHLIITDCSRCSVLPSLGKLPSLESLEIKNVSNLKTLGSKFLGIGSDNADGIGEEGSSSIAFQKLQKLSFEMLDEWEEWTELDGDGRHANVMPSLSSLSIINCSKLRAIPDYIKRKENLEMVIEKCPLLERKNPEENMQV